MCEPRRFLLNWKCFTLPGEVSERFKEHAWKACVGEILPWVRIPPSPPENCSTARSTKIYLKISKRLLERFLALVGKLEW